MPLGPREVLSKLATVLAARMLAYTKGQYTHGLKGEGMERIRMFWLVGTYLVSFKSFCSLAGALVSEDEEGSAVFVEC